jgi:ribosomal protein S18 acetylase RimI-like enzyme
VTISSFIQPSTADEAVALLQAFKPAIDSPTQHQIFSEEHQRMAFERGSRKPEWVWAAVSNDGEPLCAVAAWGPPARQAPWMLDWLAAPLEHSDLARALVRRATADCKAAGSDEFEALLYAPAIVDPPSDPSVAAAISVFEDAGYSLLVVRRRYDVQTNAASISIPETQLRFEQLEDGADPRLSAVYGEILVNSLDAHDAAALAHASLDEVVRTNLADMLEDDPVSSYNLAIDKDDNVVGLAVGSLRGPVGRGVASYIGVSHRFRGNGYAAQLLGFITSRLIEAGAVNIIAETDVANVPMAAAFDKVGYPQTESRVDLAYPR